MTGAPLPLAVISADQQIGFTFQLLICFGNTYYFMCKRTDSRVTRTDFGMGGTRPPPHRGGHMGGDRGPMGVIGA